jgi:hypothetical protein
VVNEEGYVLGKIAAHQPTPRPTQDLGQWIRGIEEDERRRMAETPTQRRTRERREQIEETRRFTQIVEDVRRLPNGPERHEVFRRFWANLYTQEYQDPLAREGAEWLSIRTATLRELEALEDEERRESGGRELVRQLTLYYEDGGGDVPHFRLQDARGTSSGRPRSVICCCDAS